MLEESNPRTSAKWVPHSTFVADLGGKRGLGETEKVATEPIAAQETV